MRYEIIHGDAIDYMRTLASGSVDHVITDPPYDDEAHTMGRRTPVGTRGRPTKLEVRVIGFKPLSDETRLAFLEQCARVCSGWLLSFCQAEQLGAYRDDVRAVGGRWVRSQFWRKRNAQPQLTGDRPGVGYESIATAWFGAGRSRWNGGGRHGWYEHEGIFDHNVEAGSAMRRKRLHETEKPLALMLELVELFTKPGELVLDPFCGSATTGAACVRLGRDFVGVECQAKHVRTARRRMLDELRTYVKPKRGKR